MSLEHRKRKVSRLIYSGSGYLLSVGISAAVGIISVPVVIQIAGATAWSSLAVAQAVGAIAATFVAFGWPVLGPAAVAAASPGERGRIFRLSLYSRGIILLPALGVSTVIIIATTADRDQLAATLIAGASPVLGGLTATWFFVGESRPSKLNILDVLPRAAGSVSGIVLILFTHNVLSFVASQCAGQLLALILSWYSVKRRYPPGAPVTTRDVMRSMQVGSSGFSNAILTSSYQNSPLLIISIFAPGGVVVYAMADRLFRVAALALAPVTQVAQGYVPAAPNTQQLRKRIWNALGVTATLALITCLSFGLLSPWAGAVLSGGQVVIPLSLSFFLGGALALALTSSVVGRACLVPLGRLRTLAVAASMAAAFGLVCMVLGGLALGFEGVAAGYLIAEMIAAATVATVLFRALRQPPHTQT